MGMSFAFLDIPELLIWCLDFVHVWRDVPKPLACLGPGLYFLMTGLFLSSFPPVALNSLATSFCISSLPIFRLVSCITAEVLGIQPS